MCKIKVNKMLDCGCCGQYFKTWEGYQDQDQDTGYGICKECQGIQQQHDNEAVQDGINTMIKGMKKQKNIDKLKSMTMDEKRAVVWQALDDGVLKFEISPSY